MFFFVAAMSGAREAAAAEPVDEARRPIAGPRGLLTTPQTIAMPATLVDVELGRHLRIE